MYTEIVKIIEAGIALDRKRVMSYANVLADNLEHQGDAKFATRIRGILSRTSGTPALLDAFGTKPVDSESHMDIVDVSYPSVKAEDLILDANTVEEVNDFVSAYQKRDELVKIGAPADNSLLLYGPPGCGKTSVANLISAKSGLPLVTARFDTLVSSLLGSTSKNIRKVFEYASQKPCVLFLDEFDVVAKKRDDENELGELKRVVNGLIQEMDDFSTESILIAATNHHELLDRAIWRRFTKVLKLDMPTEETIRKLLVLYLNGNDDGFLLHRRDLSKTSTALKGFSHSGVKTCAMNALKGAIISGRSKVGVRDLLKESYLAKHHAFADDKSYIEFLLRNGFSIRTIHEEFGLPMRKVRDVSFAMNKGDCT